MREALNNIVHRYRGTTISNRELLAWIEDSNQWIFIYNCLRVQGIEINKKELVNMLEGTMYLDMDLETYTLVQRLKDAYEEMKKNLAIQGTFDERLLNHFAGQIFEENVLRINNLPVYSWQYIPPHFNEMKDVLFFGLRKKNRETHFLDRAVGTHMCICASYLYGDKTPLLAVLAMMYEFLSAGMPLPELLVDCEEYDALICQYLKSGSGEFADLMERSMMNRLDAILVYATVE